MELHLQSHQWERRLPDWIAAAIAGFAAGAVLMVLELLWARSSFGESPWSTSRMVAAIVLGPDTLQSSAFSVSVIAAALVTHYLLGIVFAIVLAAVVIAPFHLDSSLGAVLLTGAVFGAVLYMFNFYFMSYAFPWFAEMRGWATFIGHLVFGMTAAGLYWKFEGDAAA